MNLISNCCAAAYIYRDYLKVQYPNPFIWSSIATYDDMHNLIKNYKNINFNNVEMIKFCDYIPITYWTEYNKQYKYLTGLKVDNTFNVFWVHNYYDPNCKTPKICGGEVYYYKNYEYTLDNWYKRIKRMNLNEKPIFMVLTQRNHGSTFENSLQLLKDFPDENIIMITSFKELLQYNTKTHHVYFTPCVDRSPEWILKEMYNQIDFNFT